MLIFLTNVPTSQAFRHLSLSGFHTVPKSYRRFSSAILNLQQASWERDLNPAQLEAVTKPLCSITRVIAGPGSGKTRVLTSRIAYLLQEDPKARILAVTFTKKAANEMQVRLEALLKESARSNPSHPRNKQIQNDSVGKEAVVEEEYSEDGAASYLRDLARVSMGTFHKVCADILRYNGNLLSSLPSVEEEMMGRNATVLDGSFAIMDQADQLRILKQTLTEKSIDLKDASCKPMEILDVILDIKAAYYRGENPLQTSTDKTKKPIPKKILIAQKIYGTYRETMLSNNLLDFDDLIYLARELISQHQEVRQQLHRRWTHILVDEYQDTSRAQIDLVRLWTASSLLVVGDGDQSIYSWRGADPSSLTTFEDEFRAFLGDIETVHLTDNYRSTSNIVKAAQKVIASDESLAKKLRQDMTPRRGSGSTPRIVACANGKAEASYVVKTVQNKLESNEYNVDTSVAILYRTNAQSRLLEEACVEHNLPYVILGKATSFYKRREVKDCLCFLRWLYNGRDAGSMLRAFQTPSRGLGDKAIEQFENYYNLVSEKYKSIGRQSPTQLQVLFSFLEPEAEHWPKRKDSISTRPFNLFTDFAKQMQVLQQLAEQESVDKLLSAVIDTFELMGHFEKISDSKSEFQERQQNVEELQQATRRYSKDGPSMPCDSNKSEVDNFKSPLGAFLDDVALVTEFRDGNEEEKGSSRKRFVVSLMTIHASKGMEFDAVFVTGNEDDNFPTAQAIQAGVGSVALAEECRLCYVAITRAKTELFLTWRREAAVFNPNSDNGFKMVKRNRSRFLDSLVGDKGAADRAQKRSVSTASGVSSQHERKTAPGYTTINSSDSGKLRSRDRSLSPQLQRRRPSHGQSGSRNASSDSSPRERSASRASERQRNSSTNLASLKTRSNVKKDRRSSAMDSTWFFPVGANVVHKRHGRGLVLNPPPPESPGSLKVRVKFEDGRQLEFPAEGNELTIAF